MNFNPPILVRYQRFPDHRRRPALLLSINSTPPRLECLLIDRETCKATVVDLMSLSRYESGPIWIDEENVAEIGQCLPAFARIGGKDFCPAILVGSYGENFVVVDETSLEILLSDDVTITKAAVGVLTSRATGKFQDGEPFNDAEQ